MKNVITTLQQLREVYEQPKGRAKDKVLSELEKHARNFIETAPFVVISTVNSSGKMDVSPRGGEHGFVQVRDNKTLLMPDFKGNNRLDSFTNIIETGSIGLLFLIPGIDETLRVNGRAVISTEPDLLSLFGQGNKRPISCLIITVDELFLHCAKALMRSKLWDKDAQIDPQDFPTMGQMLKDQLGSKEAPESREEMIQRYQKDL